MDPSESSPRTGNQTKDGGRCHLSNFLLVVVRLRSRLLPLTADTTHPSGKVAFELQSGSAAALPATALRFRPVSAQTRTKNVLVAANAVGSIQHW